MALSNDLISQLVKVTKAVENKPAEATVYGTTVEQDGNLFVQLDGSDVLTPVSSTVKMKSGERVIVSIKNHTATVTGNLTTRAARSDDVDDIVDEISTFEIIIANTVTADELNVERGRIDDLVSDNVLIRESLSATAADIFDLEADNVTINKKLTANEAAIESLQATSLTADIADLRYASIDDLDAINGVIYNLDATYATIADLTATRADIDSLETTKLSAEQADLRYADIDFANIGNTAIENFFSKSGILENVVISDGAVTGTLVGVTIKGDLIEGGTVVADKLVLQGDDGLYYKLNTDGATVEAEQTDYNSLNGRILAVKSVTANRINVDDLVAFDATIGGFNIAGDSLYSGVKESVDNSTSGIYLGSDGQVAFGNADSYLKFYATYSYYSAERHPVTGVFKRSTSEIDMVSGTLVEGEFTDDGHQVYSAESGSSVDYFCRIATGYKLAISADSILFGSGSKYSMEDVKQLTDHVHIGTYQDVDTGDTLPCVELSEADSTFKLRLTNKKASFMDGVNDSTNIDSDGVETENLRVKNDIRHHDFIWRRRSNGNLGLMWMEVDS